MHIFKKSMIETNNKIRTNIDEEIAGFLGLRFWMDFGTVLGGSWESQITDFPIFLCVFSMSFFKHVAEEPKNVKKELRANFTPNFGPGFRWSREG